MVNRLAHRASKCARVRWRIVAASIVALVFITLTLHVLWNNQGLEGSFVTVAKKVHRLVALSEVVSPEFCRVNARPAVLGGSAQSHLMTGFACCLYRFLAKR